MPDNENINNSGRSANMFPNMMHAVIHGGHFVNITTTSEAAASSLLNALPHPPRAQGVQPSSQHLTDWMGVHRRTTDLLGMGTALRDPSPDDHHTPSSYQQRGSCIGDVGLLSNHGNLKYYFNLASPPDHPDNLNRTPSSFTRYTKLGPTSRVKRAAALNHISTFYPMASTSWNAAEKYHEIVFTAAKPPPEGVLLFFGEGLSSEQLLSARTQYPRLRDWVSTQAYNWYRDLSWTLPSRPVPRDHLQVVIGTEKASQWLTALISKSEPNSSEYRLVVKYYSNPEHGPRCLCDYNDAVRTHVSTGPDEAAARDQDALVGGGVKNQTIFVKTCTVTLSKDEQEKMAEEIRVADSDSPAGDRQPGTSEVALESQRTSSVSRGQPSWKKYFPMAKKRASATHSTMSASTISTASSDGGPILSDDDNSWRSEPSPISSDDCMPEADVEKRKDTEAFGPIKDHPSIILNNRLLEVTPEAKLAITSDDDWIGELRAVPDNEKPPSPHDLVDRILASHDIVVKDFVVFVRPRGLAEVLDELESKIY